MLGTIYTLDLDLFKDIISFPFFLQDLFQSEYLCEPRKHFLFGDYFLSVLL